MIVFRSSLWSIQIQIQIQIISFQGFQEVYIPLHNVLHYLNVIQSSKETELSDWCAAVQSTYRVTGVTCLFADVPERAGRVKMMTGRGRAACFSSSTPWCGC